MRSYDSNVRLAYVLPLLLVALLASARIASAQVDTGAIFGTVTDESGAVVPAARVSATNEATGLLLSTATTSAGEYTFTPLKIGSYTITVEQAGFQTVARPHVTVHVQEQVKVDITLIPGQVTQTVEVTGAAPLLQTQNASVGQVVGSAQVNDCH